MSTLVVLLIFQSPRRFRFSFFSTLSLSLFRPTRLSIVYDQSIRNKAMKYAIDAVNGTKISPWFDHRVFCPIDRTVSLPARWTLLVRDFGVGRVIVAPTSPDLLVDLSKNSRDWNVLSSVRTITRRVNFSRLDFSITTFVQAIVEISTVDPVDPPSLACNCRFKRLALGALTPRNYCIRFRRRVEISELRSSNLPVPLRYLPPLLLCVSTLPGSSIIAGVTRAQPTGK